MERIVHKTIKNYDFISTCYHEAGHTIIALLQSFKVSEVEIYTENSGNTMYTAPNFSSNYNKNKKIATSEIWVQYSGIESEKILYQTLDSFNLIPRSITTGSTQDLKSAREYIRKYNLALPGKSSDTFKRKIKNKIKNKIVKHWEDITLVSNALMKNKKVKYNRIKKILLSYSPNKEYWEKKFKKIEDQF